MANRKLQGEIERTLKRVSEGLEVFDEIWEKVHDPEKANQKEKHEGDLKKEIKKLQRYRDSIKTWCSSSDIKNKAPLIEAKSLIERDMERFKVCEKEAKTKAYSKEGLQNATAAKQDEDPEKTEVKEWLEEMTERLRDQLSEREKELEKFGAGGSSKSRRGRKGFDKEEYAKLQDHIDRLNWHIQQLSRTWDRLDADHVAVETVQLIQDDVEYYIESNVFEEIDDSYMYAVLEEEEDIEETKELVEEEPVEEEPAPTKKSIPSMHSSIDSTEDRSRGSSVPSGILLLSANYGSPAPKQTEPKIKTKKTEKVKSKVKAVPAVVPDMPQQGFASIVKKSSKPTKSETTKTKKADRDSVSLDSSMNSIDFREALSGKQSKDAPASPASRSERGSMEKSSAGSKAEGAPKSALFPSLGGSVKLGSFDSRPQRKVPAGVLEKIAMENKRRHDLLAVSMTHLPEQETRTKSYVPRNPYRTPEFFPSTPASIFEDTRIFEKFDTDTLFFIFYFQQGTYQQYLAAMQLKKQSWRYHTKYLTWFQRHDDPKVTTDEYEQGTYVYFDYDYSWCQRIKSNFTFEYKFLEDELPI